MLAAILGSASFFHTTRAQQTPRREIIFPTTIEWNKQKGVNRYRLQIAGDEKFRDVLFDGLITGGRYLVSDLSAGYYYWRVAPAGSHSSSYSKPLRFFVSGGVVKTVKLRSRAIGIRSSHFSMPPALARGAARSRRRF